VNVGGVVSNRNNLELQFVFYFFLKMCGGGGGEYQYGTSLTVYEAPCADYLVIPPTTLPDSPDRFHWFILGILGLIGSPDCLAWLNFYLAVSSCTTIGPNKHTEQALMQQILRCSYCKRAYSRTSERTKDDF
jgi:hypothetical protein